MVIQLYCRGAVDNPATADFETSKSVKVIESFEDMGLKDELLRGIYDFGTCSLIYLIVWHFLKKQLKGENGLLSIFIKKCLFLCLEPKILTLKMSCVDGY